MKGHIVNISGVKYKIDCDIAYQEKVVNDDEGLGVKLKVNVFRIKDEKKMKWEELKKTYIAEKVTDFVKNAFNGQATFYWDWNQTEKLYIALCEECGYSTGYANEIKIHKLLADDGGYLISDGDGGCFSQCPKCKNESLILEC